MDQKKQCRGHALEWIAARPAHQLDRHDIVAAQPLKIRTILASFCLGSTKFTYGRLWPDRSTCSSLRRG